MSSTHKPMTTSLRISAVFRTRSERPYPESRLALPWARWHFGALPLSGFPMRLLHTMLRVGELDRSIAFYCDVLGMKLLRRQAYPEGKFTLAFVGYQDDRDGAVIHPTHHWATRHYVLGTAYGHLAPEVSTAAKTQP